MPKFSLENIDADSVSVSSRGGSNVRVDLNGIDAEDIVSQMDMPLLRAIVQAAGEELCIEVHGIQTE